MVSSPRFGRVWHRSPCRQRRSRMAGCGARMKHATSRTLHEYWVRCGGRAGVAATALSVDLAPLLPSIFLLDVGADLRFSLCGEAIARRYGRDLLGDRFLALWTARDREQMERHVRVMAASSGLVAGVLGETVGAGFVAFEMLLLPLRGKGGVTGAIGSMERVGGHEESNR